MCGSLWSLSPRELHVHAVCVYICILQCFLKCIYLQTVYQNKNLYTSCDERASMYMCVCVCEHCTCRDNLATDGFYGLVIVLLSLVGFISVVWLQDQIRNGGGPQWLEQDRIEVHRMERRAAEDELNNLQAHLDEVERRARARQRAPERVEAAREVSLLWAERDKYLEKLQVIQRQRFDRKLEDLRLRAMELSYDLGVGQKHYMMLLGSARHKYSKNLDTWRKEHNLDAPDVGSNCPPPDWKKGLSREELAIMEVCSCKCPA